MIALALTIIQLALQEQVAIVPFHYNQPIVNVWNVQTSSDLKNWQPATENIDFVVVPLADGTNYDIQVSRSQHPNMFYRIVGN